MIDQNLISLLSQLLNVQMGETGIPGNRYGFNNAIYRKEVPWHDPKVIEATTPSSLFSMIWDYIDESGSSWREDARQRQEAEQRMRSILDALRKK